MGRDKKRFFGEAPSEYKARIARYLPFEVLEVPASRHREPRKARKEEAQRILSVHGQGRRLFSLEVFGKALSSEKLAHLMGRFMHEGRDVDLVIGGDEGLDPTVSERAETTLSLGPLTLPHQLARLVLLEQIYRAMTILRGEPYHK